MRPVFLLGAIWALTGLVWAGSAGGQAPPASEDCLACHADRGLERSAPGAGRPASVFVDSAALEASVHGPFDCVACHATATAPHEERLPRVRCAECHPDADAALGEGAHASPRRGAGPRAPGCTACHGSHGVDRAASLSIEPCAACHRLEVSEYRDSVHGRSNQREGSEAATCTSCHGEAHTVLKSTDARAPTYHLSLPRTCAKCHGDAELAKRHNIPVGNVYQLYLDSIHGRALTRSGLLVAANCSDCHGAHGIRPPSDPASRVHRAKIPATCGTCHAGVLAIYRESIHGRESLAGNPVAPICVDCHTAHEIRRVEVETWKLDIVRECGTCHAESLHTYRDTFHGKVTALGFSRVARCSDCHGAHDTLPASDPQSLIHPANLVTTCQRCHPAANDNFARYDPHADPRNRARNPLLYYAARFMTWLLVGVFGFFGVHTSLWGVRALMAKRRGATSSPGPPEAS